MRRLMLDKARTKSFIPCWHHFKIGWNYSLYKGNRNYPFSSSMYLSSSFWLCSTSPEQWTHTGQVCASLARGNGCYSFSTWTSPSFPQLFDCHWPYTSGMLLKCILPLSSGKCCTYALRYSESFCWTFHEWGHRKVRLLTSPLQCNMRFY